ncbi:MAB_1171c family putative transporter [Amycolatopsis sp. NPDC059021]|uniref:MAB_1171c family putative transporter n=1 Tax=Amycolatopsis sp. NPDC059021 TaxID=3346704 RepID=UPI00366F7940
MGSNLAYLLSAACGAAIFIYKLPALLRAPQQARRTIRPLCLGGLVTFASFFFAAPTIAEQARALTGIANLAPLLVHIFSIGVVCAAQTLVLNWRFDAPQAWQRSRRVLIGGAVVMTAMCVLFALSPRVEERHLDFTMAFATTPYLAEFIILYFVAYLLGFCDVVYQCWRGARDTPDDKKWLRRGIRLTAIGMLFTVAYAVISVVAVVAAWFGVDLSYWGAFVAPRVTTLGVPEFLVAISIASWGPRLPSVRQAVRNWWTSGRDCRRLRPLWTLLKDVDPRMVHTPRTLADRISIEFRLFWRVVEINDWLERLRALADPDLATVAAHRAADVGLPDEQAAALVEAAQIRVALRAFFRGAPRRTRAALEGTPAPENKHAFATERGRLVAVAQALASPHLPGLIPDQHEAEATR